MAVAERGRRSIWAGNSQLCILKTHTSANKPRDVTIGEQTRCGQSQFNMSLAMAVAPGMEYMAIFPSAAAQVWRQPRLLGRRYRRREVVYTSHELSERI